MEYMKQLDAFLAALVREVSHTEHFPPRVGFLTSDSDAEWQSRTYTVAMNPDGERARNIIEALCNQIEHLSRFAQHDIGCVANDLDPLDKSACTCGLREHLHAHVNGFSSMNRPTSQRTAEEKI